MNTIKNATNFDGSLIQSQLADLYQGSEDGKANDQKAPDTSVDDEDLF